MDLVTRQKEERKGRILEVARSLIAERGFNNVTMRELAELSLVSVPTLYNFFGGKNELLFAAVQSYFADLMAIVPDPIGEVEPGNRGLSSVLSLAETMGREIPRHAAYARSLMVLISDASETGGIHEFVVQELSNHLVKALAEMQKKRQLVDWADPRVLGECLSNQLSISTFNWARHQLSDEDLPNALLYATSVTLLGLARGKAAAELQGLVRKHQGAARR